ncbi:MAG: MFS transporter [Deltaproteobacteria bacterium RIFCSPLOWO2_12_FULL_57_22]|nr:MAG: MFS transporter [Deltaproteobacteria bacterium RIFCSPLOWO2_12_FULL_57_22]
MEVNSPAGGSGAEGGLAHRRLNRMLDVRPEENLALAWSWLYIFSVLSSYYIIRPIRDEMGVAGGVENLQWLFTGTLIGMVLVNPPFAALVTKLPRARFISVTYRFFIANLLLFALLLKIASAEQNIWVGRIFFIWTSVFNLFVVSVFWALMVDVFNSEQGKRLFGFISAGATLGGIVGSSLTAALAQHVPSTYLLLGSAVLLEVAVFSVRRLSRLSEALRLRPTARGEEAAIGGRVLSGLTHAFKSPYLVNVGVYILLYAITSTFLYFQQAEIARHSFASRGARTTFFAQVDLLVSTLTLVIQLFLTGRLLRALGVGLTLTLLPALSVLGFSTLALAPTIAILVIYQVLRRAGNFAVARPTREVLFTVVPREDKYKAKSFIDTAIYRAGDQVGAWSYALLGLLGLGMTGISIAAVPISAAWLLNGLWLGRKQETLATGDTATSPMSVSATK